LHADASQRTARPRAPLAGSDRDAKGVTSLVVDALAHALAQVFRFEGPADAVMSRFFREHPALGRRDRSLVAEAIFFALRRYATLGWALQPATAARALCVATPRQ
jgi:16S rRNA (cytosine967-C5)-methyltransferase